MKPTISEFSVWAPNMLVAQPPLYDDDNSHYLKYETTAYDAKLDNIPAIGTHFLLSINRVLNTESASGVPLAASSRTMVQNLCNPYSVPYAENKPDACLYASDHMQFKMKRKLE
jgi:hypothetical protein